MGGFGSGWNKTRKRTVESCLPLHIKTIRPSLTPGYQGWVSWGQGGGAGKISYQVIGDGNGRAGEVRLYYTAGRGDDKKDLAYLVGLTYDTTPWGARRAWFICPNTRCGRRVGALYLPPGEYIFACRHCHNLTYQAAQEAHSMDDLYRTLAAGMGPGYTLADGKYMLDLMHDKGQHKLPPAGGGLARDFAYRLQELIDQANNPHPDYLTAGDLCESAGLAPADLAALGDARLLVPDTADGRYRPRLARWAAKLAYLRGEGWSVADLRAWARGRWATPDPRAWPPDRAQWSGEHDQTPG